MKHLTFYYAIGFAVAGCLMLCFGVLISSEITSNKFPAHSVFAFAVTMLLPFLISGLCWLDWEKIRGKAE
jgi:hypothetical protein